MAKRVKSKWTVSAVEKFALRQSPYRLIYEPDEKIPSIIVSNFPLLGKIVALRFLEWVQANPGGVISLPTGKSPEYFIKWVRHLLKNWSRPAVVKELEQAGIDPASRPDMKSLHFVQIDEFYPIDSSQTNSFYHYVCEYYLKGFGLDGRKALLIDPNRIGLNAGETLADYWPQQVDLSLRYRQPKSPLEDKQKGLLERVDQWSMEYENQIAALGGLGFFLGGIGPDGHIGFNISGSDHHATTRLCPINYETQAAAATDLGGIETARHSLVITIGLRTITRNPACAAIIMAAGEAKAPVVADAIRTAPDVRVPATALAQLPAAKFFLTRGAAKLLPEREYQDLRTRKKLSEQEIDHVLFGLAVRKGKRLNQLTSKDLEQDSGGQLLLKKTGALPRALVRSAVDTIERKIHKGIQVCENTCFLHTEPHHDDVMLGYFSQIVRNFRRASNRHYFMTLTSGFTSVTNHFMAGRVELLRARLDCPAFKALYKEDYFDPQNQMARNRDVWQYLDGVAANSRDMKDEGCARRLLRNLFEVYASHDINKLRKRLESLHDYFVTQYPGKHDPDDIKRLKGMCREWEAECLWGYYGWKCDNVSHLRLGFYTGDIFTPQPTQRRDAMPIVAHLERINPDVITVALDPEASGPDTHYKVLQSVATALRIYQERTRRTDIRIWGYRNVWYRFDPAEANVFVPVSLNMFSVMHQAFENSFLSQKEASFPSYEHDGPFSELAQRIQVQQYQKLKTCLGREWFYDHTSPLIRATRGFEFLKEMEPEEFYQSCRQLRQSVENI